MNQLRVDLDSEHASSEVEGSSDAAIAFPQAQKHGPGLLGSSTLGLELHQVDEGVTEVPAKVKGVGGRQGKFRIPNFTQVLWEDELHAICLHPNYIHSHLPEEEDQVPEVDHLTSFYEGQAEGALEDSEVVAVHGFQQRFLVPGMASDKAGTLCNKGPILEAFMISDLRGMGDQLNNGEPAKHPVELTRSAHEVPGVHILGPEVDSEGIISNGLLGSC